MFGRTADLAIFRNSIQTCAVVVPLLKFALEMVTWNVFTFIGIYGSMAAYFVILAIESALITTIPDMAFIYQLLFRTIPFYFFVFLAIVTALSPDFSVKYIHRTFFPDNWQILQEYEHRTTLVGLPETDELDMEERAAQKVKIQNGHSK